jgi:hypothetical protein
VSQPVSEPVSTSGCACSDCGCEGTTSQPPVTETVSTVETIVPSGNGGAGQTETVVPTVETIPQPTSVPVVSQCTSGCDDGNVGTVGTSDGSSGQTTSETPVSAIPVGTTSSGSGCDGCDGNVITIDIGGASGCITGDCGSGGYALRGSGY